MKVVVSSHATASSAFSATLQIFILVLVCLVLCHFLNVYPGIVPWQCHGMPKNGQPAGLVFQSYHSFIPLTIYWAVVEPTPTKHQPYSIACVDVDL